MSRNKEILLTLGLLTSMLCGCVKEETQEPPSTTIEITRPSVTNAIISETSETTPYEYDEFVRGTWGETGEAESVATTYTDWSTTAYDANNPTTFADAAIEAITGDYFWCADTNNGDIYLMDMNFDTIPELVVLDKNTIVINGEAPVYKATAYDLSTMTSIGSYYENEDYTYWSVYETPKGYERYAWCSYEDGVTYSWIRVTAESDGSLIAVETLNNSQGVSFVEGEVIDDAEYNRLYEEIWFNREPIQPEISVCEFTIADFKELSDTAKYNAISYMTGQFVAKSQYEYTVEDILNKQVN